MEVGDDGVENFVDSKDMQQQSKAFDKLTDRVEDRQLDSTRVQEAMASIYASKEADIQAARLSFLCMCMALTFSLPVASLIFACSLITKLTALGEKELAAVKINAGDVDIIANELELDKKVAERTLREHKGDAVASIRSLLY
ncbi:hypothetical protein SASPL_140103 [Salvia splendens]|uniref:Nascent polypeptide-associated complex subunit alpha-like UBA domain-containing protein n=1 Tax=Salvia splendens TaxID=180675 RepID=A0A8X8ZBB0_SALSN|nr:hypothetical protein SASPL_140103 [Salvia splendens]